MRMLKSANEALSIIRERTDAIGLAFSAGKDSHVTLDLLSKKFNRIEAFYLYRVADLEVIRRLLARVEHRYGIKVQTYPHFDLSRCFRHAVLQPHWGGLDKTPKIGMSDIENHFRQAHNVEWIAYGWRRNDSRSRAMIIRQTGRIDWKAQRIFPVGHWRRQDIINYLRANRIQLPPSFGRREQGGVDFHPETLNYLEQRFPDDYRKLIEVFPYAPAFRLATIQRRDSSASEDKAAPE